MHGTAARWFASGSVAVRLRSLFPQLVKCRIAAAALKPQQDSKQASLFEGRVTRPPQGSHRSPVAGCCAPKLAVSIDTHLQVPLHAA
jgi:hypothetical protein